MAIQEYKNPYSTDLDTILAEQSDEINEIKPSELANANTDVSSGAPVSDIREGAVYETPKTTVPDAYDKSVNNKAIDKQSLESEWDEIDDPESLEARQKVREMYFRSVYITGDPREATKLMYAEKEAVSEKWRRNKQRDQLSEEGFSKSSIQEYIHSGDRGVLVGNTVAKTGKVNKGGFVHVVDLATGKTVLATDEKARPDLMTLQMNSDGSGIFLNDAGETVNTITKPVLSLDERKFAFEQKYKTDELTLKRAVESSKITERQAEIQLKQAELELNQSKHLSAEEQAAAKLKHEQAKLEWEKAKLESQHAHEDQQRMMDEKHDIELDEIKANREAGKDIATVKKNAANRIKSIHTTRSQIARIDTATIEALADQPVSTTARALSDEYNQGAALLQQVLGSQFQQIVDSVDSIAGLTDPEGNRLLTSKNALIDPETGHIRPNLPVSFITQHLQVIEAGLAFDESIERYAEEHGRYPDSTKMKELYNESFRGVKDFEFRESTMNITPWEDTSKVDGVTVGTTEPKQPATTTTQQPQKVQYDASGTPTTDVGTAGSKYM
ncbi:hypothetical protein [Enterovibrio baiacu]|uniref:hypothetical protein n=1 Tax=Enterovibrio baiacu TaxID=2491023 RepID=UPI001010BDC7|nr:hypothetical protein [Enterovibrio baiacu]MBE1275095.1 hypothetical protein [Enterovibrio baiacu]